MKTKKLSKQQLTKLDVPLSGKEVIEMMKEIEKKHNDSSLMLDTDIRPDMTPEDIFNGKGSVILFHSWGKNEPVGHFVSLHRFHDKKGAGYAKDGLVYYFDSFGKKMYNPAIPEVLLKQYPQVLYNDVKFQKDESNACGRHCIAVSAFNKMGMDPFQIEEVLKSIGDVDNFVVDIFRKDK